MLAEPPRLLFCASASYFQHLAVTAVSATANTPGPMVLHVLTCDHDPAAEALLRQSLADRPGLSLTLHHVSAVRLQGLFADRHISADAYLRFLAPEFLPPSAARVIYLDCDTVVLADLRPLWQLDLKGKAVGAALDFTWDPDGTEPRRLAGLGIEPGHIYVNSGVLLIDLERWRRDDIGRRLMEWAAAQRELRFHDQDALNAVLQGDIQLLDCRWNLQARMYQLPRRAFPEEFAHTREARRAPAILHYTTANKPWLFRSSIPRKRDYFRYLRMTAFHGARPPLRGWAQQAEYALDRAVAALGQDYLDLLSYPRRIRREIVTKARLLRPFSPGTQRSEDAR